MFRDNHYVPEWYQKRFFPPGGRERKFCYLDLHPAKLKSPGGVTYTRTALNRWGPDRCFKLKDLYTTTLGPWFSTEIEQKFFGSIEMAGKRAVEHYATYDHENFDPPTLEALLRYVSVQRLRTPKGLVYLAASAKLQTRNGILMALQALRDMHCAIWTECVWSIADASASPTKFVLTDNPVTFYNRGIFPASRQLADIRHTGTHTIFPLSYDKLLILTNLSWIRNPYVSPTKLRPNPDLFRGAFFDFRQIQTGRMLSEAEVQKINLVMIANAARYVAAAEKQWLYPEQAIKPADRRWDRLDDGYLFMPDPRGVTFSGELIIGYKGGRHDFFDAYGHKPWQPGYDSRQRNNEEWKTFHAFQGEFARIHGPKRRGRSFQFDRLDPEEDSPEHYQHDLEMEGKFKPPRANRRR